MRSVAVSNPPLTLTINKELYSVLALIKLNCSNEVVRAVCKAQLWVAVVYCPSPSDPFTIDHELNLASANDVLGLNHDGAIWLQLGPGIHFLGF